jgi:hypothetical protein
MRLWCTKIKAVCPNTNKLLMWAGPIVPGINQEDAKYYLSANGLGYCEVDDEFISEIDEHSNKEFSYQTILLN